MKIYHIDQDNSEIRWQGIEDGSALHGTIRFADGHFIFETGELLEGSANIDIPSVQAEDAAGATREDVEALLKSADVLDADRYATAYYKFSEVIDVPDGRELKGMLWLKDRVFHLTIPVELTRDASSLSVAGSFNVQRINPQLYAELTDRSGSDPEWVKDIQVHLSIRAIPGA